MFQYSIEQWVFFFYLYCLFGWCFESSYVSLKTGHFVNRGFMRGPFLPIYGSGAIMMLVVSAPFSNMQVPGRYVLIYVAGCIGATVLEYVTGVVMEALFKVRYWDYSNKPFNFQGHICLSSTLAWGALTVLVTEYLHKPFERFVLGIPDTLLSVCTVALTAVISADFVLSFKAALDLRDVLVRMEKVREEMAHMQKRLDVLIALTGEELEKYRDEVGELRDRYKLHMADKARLTEMRDAIQRHMLRSNPSMMSVHFGEALKELQEKLEQEMQEKRLQLQEKKQQLRGKR
ncbi:MAG: hypothetical protein IJ794_09005 [Lachnospiraceae bacterium]|nr:hypothetical protein [Lachnospiraceae bacterium]